MSVAGALRVVVPRHCAAPCRRACSAGAAAAHGALPPTLVSRVQTACLARARPTAAAALAGGAAARCAAPPGRRDRQRKARAKARATAEGKTKGGGTPPPAKAVCTWGRRGTSRLRRRAASGAQSAPVQRRSRASHARARCTAPGCRP
ncbi:hypothetical protein EA663_00080 [Pseudoxanthomonas winnipegensis]|nr:hypothetical protein EA663_00080 [Pseudoxanthomonas winnipegensis]